MFFIILNYIVIWPLEADDDIVIILGYIRMHN